MLTLCWFAHRFVDEMGFLSCCQRQLAFGRITPSARRRVRVRCRPDSPATPARPTPADRAYRPPPSVSLATVRASVASVSDRRSERRRQKWSLNTLHRRKKKDTSKQSLAVDSLVRQPSLIELQYGILGGDGRK